LGFKGKYQVYMEDQLQGLIEVSRASCGASGVAGK